MTRLAVGVLQMNSSSEVERNMSSLVPAFAQAQEAGVEALFLPENFAALGHARPRQVAEQHSESVIARLCELSHASGIWTFAGTLPCADRPDGTAVPGDRVRAASLVIDPAGDIVARYDKIHMFDVEVADNHRSYQESATFEAGESLESLAMDSCRVGLSVCYDIRFPVLYQSLARIGADIITIPCAFTVPTGEAHFEVLLRARAIETQAFVIAACQAGRHDSGRQTYGHSMVISPWGEVLLKGDDHSAGLLTTHLDLGVLAEIRRDMPIQQQQRLNQ